MADSPPPAAPERSLATAALVVIAWAAFVVAADGILSLVLNIDVVPQRGAGPLVGPEMVAAATLTLLIRFAVGVRPRRAIALAVECLALSYLAMFIVGSIAYAVVRRDPAEALIFASSTALSVFVTVPALLAAVAGIAFATLLGARDAGATRPRWPWEQPDEP